jgi:uncharacterized protein YjbI with pentapeptide repeats
MAAALLTCSQEHSISDEEADHLAALIGDGMEKGLLVEYVKYTLEETNGADPEQVQAGNFQDAVIANLEGTSWVDLTTTSIPVPEVIDEFVKLLPEYVRREAAKPGSLLFNPQVISSLRDLVDSVHGIQESLQELLYRSARTAAIEPHDSLLKAAQLIKSPSAEEAVIGIDIINRVYGNSIDGAKLVVPFVCAFLRGKHEDMQDEKEPAREYERTILELRLIDLLRTILSESVADEVCPDVDLTGATLSRLDLSNVHLGRLILNDTTIKGNLKIRNATTHDHALLQRCIVEGVADFQNTRFMRGLSCKHAVFATLDFSNVQLDEACSFENAAFLGSAGFSDHELSVDVSSTVFTEGVSFNGAWVGEGVDLRSLIAKDAVSFVGSSFCASADLTGGHFLAGLDMSDCSIVDFLNVDSIHVYEDLNLDISEVGRISVDRAMIDTNTTLHLPDDALALSVNMEQLGNSIRLSGLMIRPL